MFFYKMILLLILCGSAIAAPNGYVLTWNDEFDGDSLNSTKWDHRYPGRQYKIGYYTTDAVSVSNGTLKIKTYVKDGKIYTGQIGTDNKFLTKYGYFEIRFKLPKIYGPQAAFWLQSPTYGQTISNPGKSGVEIDIFEYVKTTPNVLHHTLHWDGYGVDHKKQHFGLIYPEIANGKWHTVGLLWTNTGYQLYVDGTLRFTTNTAISNVMQYMIISAGVTGWGGDIFKEKIPEGIFEVDYVRVYKKVE